MSKHNNDKKSINVSNVHTLRSAEFLLPFIEYVSSSFSSSVGCVFRLYFFGASSAHRDFHNSFKFQVAESTVDEAIRADGRHIRVEEESLIGLAFILPEDGYSCDIVRGIPTGLVDFLTPLSPLCRLTPNPSAAGYWTIYFQDPMRSPRYPQLNYISMVRVSVK